MSEPDQRTTLEFLGETFHMNPGEDYQWEMMEFAGAATGVEVNSLSGAAAVYGLLKAVIVVRGVGAVPSHGPRR